MHIRPATTEEIELCVELNNRCLIETNPDRSTGFLLSKLTVTQLEKFNDDGILRVAILNDRLVGFILAFKRESEFFAELIPLIDSIEWLDPSIPSIQKLLYVYKKAVEPSARRRGVASSMYRALVHEFAGFGLLGATVEKPISNEPSRLFREKHQYRRVGTFRAPEFDGLKDYQSGIYFKESV